MQCLFLHSVKKKKNSTKVMLLTLYFKRCYNIMNRFGRAFVFCYAFFEVVTLGCNEKLKFAQQLNQARQESDIVV